MTRSHDHATACASIENHRPISQLAAAPVCYLDPQKWQDHATKAYGKNHLSLIEEADEIIKEWNSDAVLAESALQDELRKNIENLVPPGVTKDQLPEPIRKLVDRYGVADTLALYFQKSLQSVSTRVLVLASFGLICFELAHWLAHLPGKEL